MSNLTSFDHNSQDGFDLEQKINHWLEQEQDGIQFPVPFDEAWKIAGYSKKSNAKRYLPKSAQRKHYITYAEKSGELGRPKEKIYLSIVGFVRFLIISNTEQSCQTVLDIISALSGMAMGTIDFTQSSSTKAGFVYLVKQSINGYCKIGKSKNPYKRKETLQTGNPLELVILGRIFSFDCSQLEKSLHGYYSAYWIRGEWFELSDELIDDFVRVATELDEQQETAQLKGDAK